MDTVERAGLDEQLDRLGGRSTMIDPFTEIMQRLERTRSVSLLDDGTNRLSPHAADGTKSETDVAGRGRRDLIGIEDH